MEKKNELAGKLLYSLMIVVIYILGRDIQLPWIVPQNTTPDTLSMQYYISEMLGSASHSGSILALGLAPWMSASIISSLIQSATQEPGDQKQSPAKANRRTMVLTLILALIQALVRSGSVKYVDRPGLTPALAEFMTIVLWISGSFLTVWLSDQNAAWGIGGKSLLILINLLFSLDSTVITESETIRETFRSSSSSAAAGYLALVLAILLVSIFLSIFLKYSEIHLPVVRVMISNRYAEESYIPVSLNPCGTFPAMYAMSLYSLPYYILTFLSLFTGQRDTYQRLAAYFDLSTPSSVFVFFCVFCFLTIFLSLLLVNPAKIAEGLEKSGDFIDGVRPWKETKSCIQRAVLFASVCSCIGMGIVVIVPLFVRSILHSNDPIFMMPITLAILTNLFLSVFEEIRVEWRMSHYEDLGGSMF